MHIIEPWRLFGIIFLIIIALIMDTEATIISLSNIFRGIAMFSIFLPHSEDRHTTNIYDMIVVTDAAV